MSKQIVVIKPNSMSPKDKEKLTKAGYVVVEYPNPEEVNIISEASLTVSNDIIVSCALKAIAKGISASNVKDIFCEEMYLAKKQIFKP